MWAGLLCRLLRAAVDCVCLALVQILVPAAPRNCCHLAVLAVSGLSVALSVRYGTPGPGARAAVSCCEQ